MIALGWPLLISIGLLLLALLLLIGLTLLRSKIPTALRKIEAYDRLTRSVGLAVENGTRLHISLGRGSLSLAAAGLDPADVELIVFGSCSFDDQVPNQASGLQMGLGAKKAASMDVNTACTSFLYALSTANAMIRTGVVRNAVVVGGERVSAFMDWSNRGVAVLFGDGCAAVVLQATDREEGVLAERLGCDSDARQLVVKGMGTRYADYTRSYGDTD